MKAVTLKVVKFTLDDNEIRKLEDAYEIIKKVKDKLFTSHLEKDMEKANVCLALIKDVIEGNEIGDIE